MNTHLEIAIGKLNTVKSIVDILATRRVNAHHVNTSQVQTILSLLLRNHKLVSHRRQASIGSLAELFDLDVVLQKDGVSFSCGVSNISYRSDVVSQGIG